MANERPVVPVEISTTPAAAKDPIASMVEIAENDKLTDQDKTVLIEFAKNRFKNRRRMAYISLYALIVSFALFFIAAFIEAFSGYPILTKIQSNYALFTWLEGFFTAIVGAYYGISAWRPSS